MTSLNDTDTDRTRYSAVGGTRRKMVTGLLVTALLVVHFCLAVSSVRHKSNTFDEYIHLTAGYSYWTLNDYRLQPENGNLPQRWAALPLLFSPLQFPPPDSPLWKTFSVWEIGHRFMYTLGNDADSMLLKGRIMVCLLSLALGLAVFFWSRQLFGVYGGFIALGLYTFSPTILAHARLTTSDIASALFFTLAVKLIWDLLHRVSWFRVILAGLAVAGLLLSKMSGVLILPVVLLCLAVRLLRKIPLRLCLRNEILLEGRLKTGTALVVALAVVAVVSTVTLWGFYGFRFTAAPVVEQDRTLSFPTWQKELDGAGRIGPTIEFLRDQRFLPEAYLFGFTFVIAQAQKRPAFLYGDYSETGWWYFFPFCYAIKTPLVSIALLCVALGLLLKHRDGSVFYKLIPLVMFTGVYWLVAMLSNINIGHRHVLVTYPAFFIVSGAVAIWLGRYKKIGAAVLVVAFGLYILESAVAWPHYLTFFNAAVGGGSNGYRYLVDSSLDWGQDLPGLRRWLQENDLDDVHGEIPVYLSYFGTASPDYYRIQARMIVYRRFPWYPEVKNEAQKLTPGVYCISATSLQQVYGIFGGWRNDDETLYWRLDELNREYQAVRRDPDEWAEFVYRYGGFEQIARLILKYRELQFARLCRFLKQKAPDHQIGNSIQIYFVGPKDLWQAIKKPIA